jgi:hypothetical protein
MPFEDADFVNVISEKWAQQDEQCIQRLAPTNHDVSVKGDRGVYAGISLKQQVFRDITVTIHKETNALTWWNFENEG